MGNLKIKSRTIYTETHDSFVRTIWSCWVHVSVAAMLLCLSFYLSHCTWLSVRCLTVSARVHSPKTERVARISRQCCFMIASHVIATSFNVPIWLKMVVVCVCLFLCISVYGHRQQNHFKRWCWSDAAVVILLLNKRARERRRRGKWNVDDVLCWCGQYYYIYSMWITSVHISFMFIFWQFATPDTKCSDRLLLNHDFVLLLCIATHTHTTH